MKRERHFFQDYEAVDRTKQKRKSKFAKDSKINSSFEISKLLKKTYAEDTSAMS